MKLIFLAMLLLSTPAIAWSQTTTITGTVLDETAAPISFATVAIKGTNTAVSADADGNFSIDASRVPLLSIPDGAPAGNLFYRWPYPVAAELSPILTLRHELYDVQYDFRYNQRWEIR